MKSKVKFISDLKDDVNRLENQIKYNEFYSIRNPLLKTLIKTGVSTAYLLPALMASVLSFNILKKLGKTPFIIDKSSCYARVITTDTSIGENKEEFIYKEGYEYTPTFEYSTGWKLNNNNLFEREIISYRIDESIYFTKTTKEILSMSKEEINEKFIIINKQKIQKSYLEEEDYFYSDDMFIITSMYHDTNKTKIVDESKELNILTSLGYITFLIIVFAINIFNLKKVKMYKKINDMLDQKYKIVKLENIEELKEILKIRKENLELFEQPKQHVYKLKG